MSLRIVMLGDIVGTPGRQAVSQLMPVLRHRYAPDLVIANAENAANGSGLTPALHNKLRDSGIDAMTLGDHAFRKKQIFVTLESEQNIIRPANLSSAAKGRGWMKLEVAKAAAPVYVITLLGRIFMPSLPANDPFAAIDRFIEHLPEKKPIVIVEIHGEATSEKIAMGWHCNRRVAAVVGTHTHVATADSWLLPRQYEEQEKLPTDLASGGTAYITDLGMCGPHDSVLGRRVDRVLKFMKTAMPGAFDVAVGNPRINGVVIDIDENSGLSTAIERIELAADVNQPPFTSQSI